jgi:CRISPR-associated protein Cas8a1/Csx13
MPEGSLSIGLFDPGMTHLHRVGLAGLYMTLKSLDPTDFASAGGWVLGPRKVELHWTQSPKDLLAPIIRKAFDLRNDGSIEFVAHKSHPMGDLQRLRLHRAILSTFLQHGRTRKLAKKNPAVAVEFEDKTVVETIKPLANYQNQNAAEFLFNKAGDFRNNIDLAGWLFPGGVVRHVKYSSTTALSADPAHFLALVFAPVACLYFLITHRNLDGRYDKRKIAAIVLPHIPDLETYHRCYQRYLATPVQMLYAYSLGDAGLLALLTLQLVNPDGMIETLEIDSCSVMTLGTVGWATQQKTRTGIKLIRHVDPKRLNLFHLALKTLPNRTWITKENNLVFRASLSRGLVADNIAAGVPWFSNFYQLLQSQALARLISYERRELNAMVEKAEWSHEADRFLVEAVHKALRNRYGALAQRAKASGEAVQFGREFEKIRASLMRSKNAQTLRAELADLFARGGLNQTLQEHWAELLPLFSGSDWQRARDLALLGLASYKGKGVKDIEEELGEEESPETQEGES